MDAIRQGPAHPLALLALGTLVANDWIGKAYWPSFVTGKLSDVAWLVLAPVVVAAMLAHLGASARLARGVALGLVGAAFVALQVWPPLGETWVALTGGRHVADLQDLACLPALALAPWCWRGPPRRRGTLVLPVAALACAATSYPNCAPTRFPEDGEAAWDPSEPLVIGLGLFGQGQHDTAGVVSAITLTTADGTPVPFVATSEHEALWLCPVGGLRDDTDYVWTIEPFATNSANHVHPYVPGPQSTGTTRFRTGATRAFEPAASERECVRLAAEALAARDVGRVCGDTGSDDTGADTDTGVP